MPKTERDPQIRLFASRLAFSARMGFLDGYGVATLALRRGDSSFPASESAKPGRLEFNVRNPFPCVGRR